MEAQKAERSDYILLNEEEIAFVRERQGLIERLTAELRGGLAFKVKQAGVKGNWDLSADGTKLVLQRPPAPSAK